MKINEILKKPVLTEKATNLTQSDVYTFDVSLKANKFQIKQVIEEIYKVKVADIKIVIRKGKRKKVGKKMVLKARPNRKIAYIKLSEGKINLFPQT